MTEQYLTESKPSASIADLLKSFVKPKSLRQQFILEAVERINLERKGTQWQQVTPRAIAIRVNLCCKTSTDLHYFQKRCQEAEVYGKAFFGMTKLSVIK